MLSISHSWPSCISDSWLPFLNDLPHKMAAVSEDSLNFMSLGLVVMSRRTYTHKGPKDPNIWFKIVVM